MARFSLSTLTLGHSGESLKPAIDSMAAARGQASCGWERGDGPRQNKLHGARPDAPRRSTIATA